MKDFLLDKDLKRKDRRIVEKYGKKCQYIWAQEEPKNMGAWSYILCFWKFGSIICCSREASASPASGSSKVHEIRHNKVIDTVMKFAIKN